MPAQEWKVHQDDQGLRQSTLGDFHLPIAELHSTPSLRLLGRALVLVCCEHGGSATAPVQLLSVQLVPVAQLLALAGIELQNCHGHLLARRQHSYLRAQLSGP